MMEMEMEINTYSGFKQKVYRKYLFSKNIFSDFEKFVDINDLKYLYPKGWLVNMDSIQVVAITDKNFLVWNISNDNCNLRVMNLGKITKMNLQRISSYDWQLIIDFCDGYQIVLSNADDTTSYWKDEFREYIQDIFKLLTKN